MKKLLTIIFACVPLITQAGAKISGANLTLPSPLQNCRVYKVTADDLAPVTVVHCPQSDTTTGTNQKNGNITVIIDNTTYELVKKN